MSISSQIKMILDCEGKSNVSEIFYFSPPVDELKMFVTLAKGKNRGIYKCEIRASYFYGQTIYNILSYEKVVIPFESQLFTEKNNIKEENGT